MREILFCRYFTYTFCLFRQWEDAEMLYLLQQMFIDLNLMEKFHIEVINWVIKPLLLNLVIVNDSFEFKWQKVNGNLL